MIAGVVLALGVLLIAPHRLWRFVWFFGSRRRRALRAVALGAGLTMYSAAVVALALWARPWFFVAVALVGVVAIAAILTSRPSFGRRFGLPPGRLRLAPLEILSDHGHLEALAARYGPLFKAGNTLPMVRFRPTVCVMGIDAGREVLHANDGALEVEDVRTGRAAPGRYIRAMDRAEHDFYSPPLRRAFGNVRTDGTAEALRAMVDQAVEAAGPASAAGVHPRQLFASLYRELLMVTVLGLREAGDMDHVATSFSTIEARCIPLVPAGSARRRYRELTEAVRAMDIRPDSVLGTATATCPEGADTFVANGIEMTMRASGDLAGLLAWALYDLARNPDRHGRLRAALASGTPITEAYLRELLRLHQSEYLLRRVRKPIRISGYRIPRGWVVRVCVAESHRLAEVFAEPDRFDPTRFDSGADHGRYAPFGIGRHLCHGRDLTLELVGMVLDAIVERYDLELTHDGGIEHCVHHWQPHPETRVRLTARRAPDATSSGDPVSQEVRQ